MAKFRRVEHMVLAGINRARRVGGVRSLTALPSGWRYDPIECVVARGLRFVGPVEVYTEWTKTGQQGAVILMQAWDTEVTVNQDGYWVANPPEVRRFIQSFDAGQRPHLVAANDPLAVSP